MTQHARAVVIGGGVVGVATLYHLARKGWAEAVLLERKELTSGSTWHAAGLLPLFNMSYSVGQIHKYSVNLYGTLEEETGQDVGPAHRRQHPSRHDTRPDGRIPSVRRCRPDDRRQRRILTPEQVREIWPLAVTDGLIGAIRHPDDGYIQPADLTQAFRPRRPGSGGRHSSPHLRDGHRADGRRRVAGADRSGRLGRRARHNGDGQLCTTHRRDGRPSTFPFSRYSTSTSSPKRIRRSWRATSRASPKWACCASRTAPGICARKPAGCCSARTRKGTRLLHRRTPRGERIRTVRRRYRPLGASHRVRDPPGCRSSRNSASSASTTVPSPTRRTAVPSSDRPGTCQTSG